MLKKLMATLSVIKFRVREPNFATSVPKKYHAVKKKNSLRQLNENLQLFFFRLNLLVNSGKNDLKGKAF